MINGHCPRSSRRARRRAIKAALEDADVRAVYRTALSHANQQTQGARLAFLASRANSVLEEWWVLDPEAFERRLVHTRNWLVHWGTKQKHVADDPAEMVELVRATIVVLYANLLLDLGLSEESAAEAIRGGWRLEGMPDDIYNDEP